MHSVRTRQSWVDWLLQPPLGVGPGSAAHTFIGFGVCLGDVVVNCTWCLVRFVREAVVNSSLTAATSPIAFCPSLMVRRSCEQEGPYSRGDPVLNEAYIYLQAQSFKISLTTIIWWHVV